MSGDYSREELHRKVDRLCDRLGGVEDGIDGLRGDVQSINRQLPGEEPLQTHETCKEHRQDLQDQITRERKSRIRDAAAVGGLAVISLGWHFWRLMSSVGDKAAMLIDRGLTSMWG